MINTRTAEELRYYEETKERYLNSLLAAALDAEDQGLYEIARSIWATYRWEVEWYDTIHG